jgi:hypothetical protein
MVPGEVSRGRSELSKVKGPEPGPFSKEAKVCTIYHPVLSG